MLNQNIFNQTILEDYNKIKVIRGVETLKNSFEKIRKEQMSE
jgi:hypothetical protein